MGNDQYPFTVVAANNILSNHKPDNHKDRNKNAKNENKNKFNKEKYDDMDLPLSFAQMTGKCYCCGKAGHKSPACRQKDKIPREQWAINQVQQTHAQASSSSNQASATSTISTPVPSAVQSNTNETNNSKQQMVGWAATHIHAQFYQASEMRRWILLDNESTASIFCNKELLENIREVDDDLELHTNGGMLRTNMKGDVLGFGKVWYSKDALINIFSYAQMARRH